MTVTLPDQFLEFFEESGQVEAEARIRLAVQFYVAGEASLGKAAELAGLKKWEFEKWLQRHKVCIPWTQEDLSLELASAERLSTAEKAGFGRSASAS